MREDTVAQESLTQRGEHRLTQLMTEILLESFLRGSLIQFLGFQDKAQVLYVGFRSEVVYFAEGQLRILLLLVTAVLVALLHQSVLQDFLILAKEYEVGMVRLDACLCLMTVGLTDHVDEQLVGILLL